MTPRFADRFLSEILDDLETLELPLLAWGVTTGSLSHAEVVSVIGEHLAQPEVPTGAMAGDVHEALLDAALLFQVPNVTPARYRTRMGETVRLTARLRQLFPPRHPESPPPRWWERGRTLVADYRLHTARRRYPRRDVTVEAALAELTEEPAWSTHDSAVARAQLTHRTLARFQVDATRLIWNAVRSGRSMGVIVGAGTGSGKTLGFYLPAFCAMAAHARTGRGGVHTIALYPRIELLRDQLRGAISTVTRLNSAREDTQARRLRVGVLYGDTPQNIEQLNSNSVPHLMRAWPTRGNALVCPYLTCPLCTGELVWSAQDRTGRPRERLRCSQPSCDMVITDLALTRDSLRESPPDLLFTTTEMLNRNATDLSLGSLLGWLGPRRPSLVLLDEAHTYTGMHGAQVAMLLRRWRNASRKPVTFVGLSATLRDAARFFAQLTGLPDASVDYVTPGEKELEEEGREYAIALRADPVSGVSQLSTSIQAAMLFGRVLDPLNREFLYGSRGFLFTDDLDVTNRFYDDLRDAEGSQGRRGVRQPGRVLAGLRSPDGPYRSERYADGQSWDLVQQIGHDLDPAGTVGELRVGRTSSQDVGVDQDADLVVATASLEVGYDDERVGLVLQHKAPHDAAAFIQRRGRAGRRRGTRPWTVVTLSDYGRDRLAYQAYDSLFSPELAATRLPVGNRFVLKIQGAQAMLDWLAGLSQMTRIDPRRVLTAPALSARSAPTSSAEHLAELLEKVIVDAGLQDSLINHLRRALDISTDEAQALLWEQPRALLLSVAPTSLRRLRCGWQPVNPDPGAYPRSLLPEFITRTLYEPLNVPEVTFQLPFAGEPESLPIERALREAVPGRVSRRYGHRHSADRTWLTLPEGAGQGMLDITTFVETHTPQGIWTPPGQAPVQVLRPHVINLHKPGAEIDDRSQGIPRWASQVIEPMSGLYEANIPKPSAWGDRVTAVGFATSAAGNPAEVRRMTYGADYETVYTRPVGRTVSSSVRYVFDGQPAALGFRLTADAVRFRVLPMDLTRAAVTDYLRSPQWRLLAFTAAVAEDPTLDGVANTFQRGWITLIYTTAYALVATEPGNATSNSETLYAALRGGAWGRNIDEILRVLYRDAAPAGSPAPERLVMTLTELSRDTRVIASLDRHGRLLWSDDVVTRTCQLAQRVYRDTVAAAILAAAQRACPDAQDRDLILDVQEPSEPNGPADIWLSETALGGLGIIEQLVTYYAQDPRRFWGLVDSALGPSDHEYIHDSLVQLLDHLVSEPSSPAAEAMLALRQARSAHDAEQALHRLRSTWTTLDGYPRRPAVAALSVRLLRPGSTSATDATALGLVRAWDALQQRLGIEVDATTLAYLVGTGRLTVPGTEGAPFTADQVFSLLWPRGSRARVQHLQHYQPYAGPPLIDRLLVQAAHDERLLDIDVTDSNWLDRYAAEMRARGAVMLVAPVARAQEFGRALQTVPAVAVDRDVLRVYGEVSTVVRQDGSLRAMIEVREAAQ
ncbi:Helicase conserved C-terminal domain-containing protein [Micromonospora haikouensis]|uniref:Helicase conserved C-terminal domain-containing protein n=1 Tax=Micromonospora haikouensis TaxID=686309 RepID=A0A1C4YK27_9ACTN|nr:protein DpdJ [Micromonospora haikouensis]SCF21006.1 Helicase conserved C-terminal domain-containing protein [Micromonospora haikouensis]